MQARKIEFSANACLPHSNIPASMRSAECVHIGSHEIRATGRVDAVLDAVDDPVTEPEVVAELVFVLLTVVL